MLEKIRKYVEKWHMLEHGDKVIAGISGGADSICLLFVLLELQKQIPFEIIVVHVNHGLRGAEADADEAYVKRVCEEQHLIYVSYFENIESIAKKGNNLQRKPDEKCDERLSLERCRNTAGQRLPWRIIRTTT